MNSHLNPRYFAEKFGRSDFAIHINRIVIHKTIVHVSTQLKLGNKWWVAKTM